MAFFSKKNKTSDQIRREDDCYTLPIESQDLEEFITAWLPWDMPKKEFKRILQEALCRIVDIDRMNPGSSGGNFEPLELYSFSPETGSFFCDTADQSFIVSLFHDAKKRPILQIIMRVDEGYFHYYTTTPMLVYTKYISALLEKEIRVDGETVFCSSFRPTFSTVSFVESSHYYCIRVAKDCTFEMEAQYESDYPIAEVEIIEKVLLEKILPNFVGLKEAVNEIRNSTNGTGVSFFRTRSFEAVIRIVEENASKIIEDLLFKNQEPYSYEFCTSEERITIYRNGSWKYRVQGLIAEYDASSGEYTAQNEKQEDISDQVDMQRLKENMENVAVSEAVRRMFRGV